MTNEANNTDEIIGTSAANDAILVNKANVTIKVEATKAGVSVELLLFAPFSLTKYTTIFVEVKGYFGIINNQIGGQKRGCLSPCCLMIQFVCIRESIFKNIWSKKCSLRSQCINQLERVVVNGGWSNLLSSHGKWLNNQLKWVTGMCFHHHCWIILDGRQQEILHVNLCSCNCWAESGMKQKTFTFYCFIVGTCFGGMQKSFVKLEQCRFCNCSCYYGDLSHCCSCCCSCREGLRSCDVIQTGVVVSGHCMPEVQ